MHSPAFKPHDHLSHRLIDVSCNLLSHVDDRGDLPEVETKGGGRGRRETCTIKIRPPNLRPVAERSYIVKNAYRHRATVEQSVRLTILEQLGRQPRFPTKMGFHLLDPLCFPRCFRDFRPSG